jgi:UrcA family protein
MFNIMRARPLALALAAGAMAATALPAQAARESQGVAVQYRDLDLASAEGQRALEDRLDRAARGVCGVGQTTTGSRLPDRQATRCYNETRAQLAEQFAEVVAAERRGG